MSFEILDCTLRDGGYLNNWNFSEREIIEIINSLEETNIRKIEISYLSKIKNINSIINKLSNLSKYLFMVNFSELEDLKIDNNLNIRIALKKNQLSSLKNYLNISKNLYIQPMYINYYSEYELINLIDICNNSDNIKALYIVDSFGSLKPSNIKYFYSFIDKNLNKDKYIGFHLHNNNGLGLLNINEILKENNLYRNIIIDSTLSGLGRGGGNIKTETLLLLKNELNIEPLLKIYDDILIKKFQDINIKNALIQFLTGIYSVHQSYSDYFLNKKYSLLEIENILKNMEIDRKINFDISMFK